MLHRGRRNNSMASTSSAMSSSSRCRPRCSGTSVGLFAERFSLDSRSRSASSCCSSRFPAARPRPPTCSAIPSALPSGGCWPLSYANTAAPRVPRRGARDRCRRSTNRRTRAADPYPGLADDDTAFVQMSRCGFGVAVVPPRGERSLTGLGGDVVAILEQQLAAALGELACTLDRPAGSVDSAASRPASELGGVNAVSKRRAPVFGTTSPRRCRTSPRSGRQRAAAAATPDRPRRTHRSGRGRRATSGRSRCRSPHPRHRPRSRRRSARRRRAPAPESRRGARATGTPCRRSTTRPTSRSAVCAR